MSQDLNADYNLALAEVLNNLFDPTKEEKLSDRASAGLEEQVEIPSL